MDNIKLYEINPQYINYLLQFEPHMFQNKKSYQANTRKYIGVVLEINGFDYFAPLSSFKNKHYKMQETLDFIKVGTMAVINLNNMFPVPKSECCYIDISKEANPTYRHLLYAEYREIKLLQKLIRKNAKIVYQLKTKDPDGSSLTKRCNDFKLLEKACDSYR